jgi:hypothetical protein
VNKIFTLAILLICGAANAEKFDIYVHNESHSGSNNTGGIIIDGIELSGAFLEEDSVVGSGAKGKVVRKIDNAKSLIIDLSADMRILVGSAAKLTIEGDDNIIGLISAQVHDKTLTLTNKKNYQTKLPLRITLNLPEIVAISHRSSGDIKISGLKNETLDLLLEGSGDVVVKGKTDYFMAILNGSGNLDLAQLVSRSGKIASMGSGDAEVTTTEVLDVLIDGSGDIYYPGSLKKLSKQINGSGVLIAR